MVVISYAISRSHHNDLCLSARVVACSWIAPSNLLWVAHSTQPFTLECRLNCQYSIGGQSMWENIFGAQAAKNDFQECPQTPISGFVWRDSAQKTHKYQNILGVRSGIDIT